MQTTTEQPSRTTAQQLKHATPVRMLGADARLAANDEDVVHNAQVKAYITLLQRHDWSHEFSDSHAVYSRGRDELAELRMVQRLIDPDFSVWNAHCPEQCKNGRAYS